MMRLIYLIQKEFIQIRRNSFMPMLIVIFPIMVMCVMPWVMSMEVKNIRVDVVDQDRSTLSQQLVHRIEASNYFLFNGQQDSYERALQDIETSRADVVLCIPQSYERNFVRGAQPQIFIAANAGDATKGSMGSAYLSQIVTAHLTGHVNVAKAKMVVLYLYNKNLNDKVFMIPALMGILLMLLCGFLPALNIVGEKENGTIDQINVTPISKWTFILSKLIPYWIIGIFEMTVCLILVWCVF